MDTNELDNSQRKLLHNPPEPEEIESGSVPQVEVKIPTESTMELKDGMEMRQLIIKFGSHSIGNFILNDFSFVALKSFDEKSLYLFDYTSPVRLWCIVIIRWK